ncbi:MAG: flippase-like domain-containing protein [Aquificaceae bacterium]|nr:flippase-like domain-containing protein [Aquificaceae bacterium]MCX8164439.1 flippase-like domain-containing protein [Aquificaceae bacterium]
MYRSIFYGIIVTLIFVLGSLIYILKKTFTKDFLPILLQVDKKYLFMSIFAMFLYHTFDNLRLFVLSRAMNLRYSFLYGYIVSFINTFGATITPAHMGGEFMSMYTLSRKGGKLHKVMSIVTMKTLTGMVFFLLALPYAIYHLYKNPIQSLKILTILIFFFLLFIILYILLRLLSRRKTGEGHNFFKKVKYTIKRYLVVSRIFLRDKKGSILLASVNSVLLYVCFLASGAFLIKSFNPEPKLFTLMEHQLMLLYAIFVSPTPGGSGVGEVGALYAFNTFLEASFLGGFSLLWRFITQYASALVGGLLLFLLVLKDTKRLRHA